MFIYKCTPWCPWENFINSKSFQQCEQHTPMSDMQRRNVTSLSSSAGAQMHTWMGRAVNNVHTQRHLEIFKKFTFLPVPGSSTHRPTMSFHICEVAEKKPHEGGVVTHAGISERGGLPWVPGQPGLHSKTSSQKKKIINKANMTREAYKSLVINVLLCTLFEDWFVITVPCRFWNLILLGILNAGSWII